MNKIPVINLKGINCWIVNLMPFDFEERNSKEVLPFQQACIDKKIFGMGWGTEVIEDIGENENINENNKKLYLEKVRKYAEEKTIEKYGDNLSDKIKGEIKKETQNFKALENALKNYSEIKKDDFVIIRLKNSHYYIGRVNNKAKYMQSVIVNNEKAGRISWGCHVKEWVEFQNEEELPSDIIGRFSQRYHSTIQKIADFRIKIMIISAFERKTKKSVFNDFIPKLLINQNNFVTSLNYMELEDLVCQFIYDKLKDYRYILLPSSCKINKQNFEFTFVSENRKPVTCQVKNKNFVDPEEYEKQDSYEKIYLFSGEWKEDDIATWQNKYNEKEDKNIYIIRKQELFETLKKASYLKNKFEKFYIVCGTDNTVNENKNYSYEKLKNTIEKNVPEDRIVSVRKHLTSKRYKFNDDEHLIYIGSYKFFYSPEFGAFFDDTGDSKYNGREKEFINKFLT